MLLGFTTEVTSATKTICKDIIVSQRSKECYSWDQLGIYLRNVSYIGT